MQTWIKLSRLFFVFGIFIGGLQNSVLAEAPKCSCCFGVAEGSDFATQIQASTRQLGGDVGRNYIVGSCKWSREDFLSYCPEGQLSNCATKSYPKGAKGEHCSIETHKHNHGNPKAIEGIYIMDCSDGSGWNSKTHAWSK